MKSVWVSSRPVLQPTAAGYGFEGGRMLRHDGVYHLFTTELPGEPFWVRTRMAHWTSDDGTAWRRVATLDESSGDMSGADPRAAIWSPMPIYDDDQERWNLFYIAYRAAPDTEHAFFRNHDGHIWRAVSRQGGIDGLDGPYEDEGVVLARGPASLPWEGLQGTDSFFPFRTDEGWLAFYGSARSEERPIPYWRVGVARADRLAGPWERDLGRSPIDTEPVFIENPVVTTSPLGTYVAVYDSGTEEPLTIGVMTSDDGLEWERQDRITVDGAEAPWIEGIRTPLGMLFDDEGDAEVFFTAWTNDKREGGWPAAALGHLRLAVDPL